jgi:hypothetical protein
MLSEIVIPFSSEMNQSVNTKRRLRCFADGVISI